MSANKTLNFHDKNETLEAPKGFTLTRVRPSGAFLQIDYERRGLVVDALDCATVFLNDQGREVGRTSWTIEVQLEHDSNTGPLPDSIDWSGISSGQVEAPNWFWAGIKLLFKRRKS